MNIKTLNKMFQNKLSMQFLKTFPDVCGGTLV